MELNQPRDFKNKKGFYKYMGDKLSLRKLWDHCLIRQGTWLNRMFSLPQTLLSWSAFRNAISKEWEEGWNKKDARKRIRSVSTKVNWTWVHGSWQDAPTSDERADRYHCEASPGNLWSLTGRSASWRKANVIPIFRKGKKDNPGNCRPSSLILFPGKVMEQLIQKHIFRHTSLILNIFFGDLSDGTGQVCWWHKRGRSGWQSVNCAPESLQQVGKMGSQEPHEVN